MKFISLTTIDGFDLIVNTDTIKYVERYPGDRENKVQVWADWAVGGAFVVEESFEAFKEKL